MKKWICIITSIILLLGSIAYYSMHQYQVQTPSYEIIESEGAIEIRQYQPMLVAEVVIKGERRDAIKTGFRQLADYIFGSNASVNQPAVSEKISMTAPVLQMSESEDGSDDNTWVIRFIMPEQYNIDTLPTPTDTNIELVEVPAKKYAVVRFSGTMSEQNLNHHLDLLEKYLNSNKIQTISQPIYAFYNPPWTLPFLRRNEILFEIGD